MVAQSKYWNEKTQLVPWRLPLVADKSTVSYVDLDGDGDPDVLKTTIMDGIPIMWIDDDDDMKYGDLEGDQDNDCLLIDRNNDGIFAGPFDLSVDWTDSNDDGIPDVQLIVQNGSPDARNFFDWKSDFMYIIDWGEKDGIQNFINWNELFLRAWEHDGHSNFYTDYHGNTLFLKMHASSFRISDFHYNWENPFIFFDEDGDGLTEMAIRMVDTPHFRTKKDAAPDLRFDSVDAERDVVYSKKIDWTSIAWDLDNDNGQGNQFDYDMTLRFSGDGFDYSDQVHKFKNLSGLAEADKYFYDSRWRHSDYLIYPDQTVAYNKIFNEGKWNFCWLVFDEDDDCNRWERVELYEPKALWKIGQERGGLDNNPQADAVGDRGEFDTDNSGKGQLYIAPFDGRLHLFGAEWGAWRIDKNTSDFQGYGGLYPPARLPERMLEDPLQWATIRYSDSNNNGFVDCIEYDLDGDAFFEEKVSLLDLGIDDRVSLIETGKSGYSDMTAIFSQLTDKIWQRAMDVVSIAKHYGVSTNWYAFLQHPRTLNERYQYGFWLTFYLYKDMCHVALLNNDTNLKHRLDVAYYSGNWLLLKDKKS